MPINQEQSPSYKLFSQKPENDRSWIYYVGAILLFIIAVFLIYKSGNHIASCKNTQNYPLYFTNASLDKNTFVSLCQSEGYLYLKWKINDTDIVSNYQGCHDPLYQRDSVGVMFISAIHRYVNNYYSFIISPSGIVYSQDISPYHNTHTHIFDCDQIKAKVIKNNNGWDAQLKIPMKKIGTGSLYATQIVNFFRIDLSSHKQTTVSFNDKNELEPIQKYAQLKNIMLNVKTELNVNSIQNGPFNLYQIVSFKQ